MTDKSLGEPLYLGKTCIANAKNVQRNDINKEDINAIAEIIRRNGATILSVDSHFFEPHGLSLTYILSESHVAIHTWPEYACLTIDAFTCGHIANPTNIVTEIIDYVGGEMETMDELIRNAPAGVKVLEDTTVGTPAVKETTA
mmetsp:Transcript_27952/g.32076  ORF Transcript_27952/g.32076 Transcript_27952/m.32076 type:complete len:143 (+) Transcript_27952:57-485(+)